ncbi:hypothetical protein [uncultured Streptococcus sp.]|uniref:hypothetical protein n=1 Tax=uncultured Streptococcus sp. TaxID=83427 RepID=UPI00259B6EB1|nr:hypothetical protein [uncultured Streptococcus sp.]
MPISLPFMNEKLMEGLKAQQKLAIQAAVVVAVKTIKLKNIFLQARLHIKAEKLENYAKKTYSENITDGLEGQAATAAKDYLSKVSKPELTSPIRN